ncbi:uncharacterized protein UDID_18164 [Ustilago sp. UG-2017a]|nr:uncharacterized protein UDID_18164 [Ustilago sp. UG-2017a]
MDPTKIGDMREGMADSARIGNRTDPITDSAEISNRNRRTTSFRGGSGTKRRQEGDQAQEHAAGCHSGAHKIGDRHRSKGGGCHGPECSGSRRAPVESMAVVQSPWRPWTPTDSHAKEERAHMRGGPATKRTKRKEQAPPRRGPSSRSMQMVTTQGLER